jgi:hypothetical protein
MNLLVINNWRLCLDIILLLVLLIITVENIDAQQVSTDLKVHRNRKECIIMNLSQQFNILTQINRDEYQYLRKALTDNPQPLKSLIAVNTSDTDWRRRIHADILQAWLQHKKMYLSILRDLDAVNVEKESRTAVGISRIWDAYSFKAQKEYKHTVLPLSWEVILKFEGHWPNWKVITFLRMIAAVPDKRSIEPLLWLLEHTDNSSLRQVTGQTLASLNDETVKLQIQRLSEKSGHIKQVIDETLYEMKD